MSIYTVEIDGKQYDIEGDRPPTEQEARQAVGEFSNQNEEQQVQQQPNQDRMSGRSSAMADLIQNPTTMQHPLGAILRTLYGAAEMYQGIPASIGLDLQSGNPQDILKNLVKVSTGQRPAQYGDILKGAGLPEPIAATGGLAADIVLAPGGAKGIKALGGLVGKGTKALKGIMKFDNVVKQAENSKVALDTLRDNLGKAKEIALNDVKDIPVEFNWKGLPTKALEKIKQPEYGVEFDKEGKIINTIGNMDKVKQALQDIPTTKDYVEAGNMAKREIKQYSGKVRDAMVKTANDSGKPELAKTLKDYHDFMERYNLANDHLVDKYGNAMSNKLKKTFEFSSEPVVKNAWREIAKSSPELKSIIKSRENRELFKALLKVSSIPVGGVVVKTAYDYSRR